MRIHAHAQQSEWTPRLAVLHEIICTYPLTRAETRLSRLHMPAHIHHATNSRVNLALKHIKTLRLQRCPHIFSLRPKFKLLQCNSRSCNSHLSRSLSSNQYHQYLNKDLGKLFSLSSIFVIISHVQSDFLIHICFPR